MEKTIVSTSTQFSVDVKKNPATEGQKKFVYRILCEFVKKMTHRWKTDNYFSFGSYTNCLVQLVYKNNADKKEYYELDDLSYRDAQCVINAYKSGHLDHLIEENKPQLLRYFSYV
jgi:hypothetical protein